MELKHHGILGQKWGVRNGPPYPLKKVTKGSVKDSNEIYKTLSKKEKNYVHGDDPNGRAHNILIRKDETKYLVNQILVKYGDTPVAALDMWNQGDGEVSVSIMSRSGEQYRNKGFADTAVKKGIDAFNKNKDLRVMTWGANSENDKSINLAKKNGFKYVRSGETDTGEKYVVYRITK